MSGVKKFSGKVQGEIHHVVISEEKSNAIAEEKLVTSAKVTTSEEVYKGTKKLDDMKEAMVTICRKDLYNFEGKYKVSTGWFNPDHELKKSFLHLKRTYINFFEKDIEGQDMKPYKFFVVTFDTTKLNFFMRNDSVTLKQT